MTAHGRQQDFALKRWREDRAKDDPPYYTVETRHGARHIWMSVNLNAGWYLPLLENGKLVGLRSEGLPPSSASETPEQAKALNYQFKFLSPKRRAKIEQLLSNDKQ